MTEPEKDYLNQKAKLVYLRTPSTLQPEFDSYLNLKFKFVSDLEEKLKSKFKELDEVEEHNTFFELFMEKILKDLKFHIINYDDFNTIDNQAQTKELLKDMVLIVDNNATNLKTNLQAS